MDGPIDRRENWGTMAAGFAIWAAHFMVAYAAELILPNHPAVRWIALAAAVAALAALALIWRRIRSAPADVGRLALGFAAVGIFYQTLPALIG